MRLNGWQQRQRAGLRVFVLSNLSVHLQTWTCVFVSIRMTRNWIQDGVSLSIDTPYNQPTSLTAGKGMEAFFTLSL